MTDELGRAKKGLVQLMRRHGRGVLGLPPALLILTVAIFAPALTPHDPLQQVVTERLRPPFWMEQGSREHLLGTDELGRDILSRIVFGSRVSLAVAVSATLISATLGSALGLLSGYYSGFLDSVIQRLLEIQLAFPFYLMAIVLVTILTRSMGNIIVILCIYGWVHYCRLIRAQVLSLREEDFVLAARAIGCSSGRIILGHIVPNVMPMIIILTTLQVARFILAEAGLSFLGLGIPPQTPTWGGMISSGRDYIWVAWWLETFPGIAIVVTVSSVGLIGDWLRDLLDPTLRY
jgi:peptide/nickel transport system permease protein